MSRSAITIARYEMALISIRPPTPKGMIKTPPRSGPTSVAPLNAAEFRPIALISCLSETRRGTIACRVGASNEKMIELSALMRTISTMLI